MAQNKIHGITDKKLDLPASQWRDGHGHEAGHRENVESQRLQD